MNHIDLHGRDHDLRTEPIPAADAPGAAHFASLTARRPHEAMSAVQGASPQMYAGPVDGAFAGPLSGSELTMRQRELATVAVLCASATPARSSPPTQPPR